MRFVWFVLAVFVFPAVLTAQTLENESNHRFPDLPAGVRGAALGAVALPSDPASVEVNPAAIAGLQKTTVSVSALSTSYESALLKRDGTQGHLFPTSRTAVGMNHALAAMPAGPFALAVWYRAAPEIHVGDPFALRGATDGSNPGIDCFVRNECGLALGSAGTSASRTETRFGAAAAWHSGTVGVGIAAQLVDLNERIETPRTIIQYPQFNATYDLLARRLSGREVTWNAGVTWQATPRVLLASSYAREGSFDRVTSICSTREFDSFECASRAVTVNTASIRRPDALRGSAAIRMSDHLLIAVEGVRRNYSVLTHEPYTWTGLSYEAPYRNATELHGGAEYTFGKTRPIALRAGWWRDPRRVDVPESTSTLARDVDHVTIGAGMTFNGTVFDIAVDRASTTSVRTVILGFSQSF